MSIQIEKGIPIPVKYGDRGNEMIGVFKLMEIGDSLVFPKDKVNSINSYARQAGIKTTVRTISETEKRIWRIA